MTDALATYSSRKSTKTMCVAHYKPYQRRRQGQIYRYSCFSCPRGHNLFVEQKDIAPLEKKQRPTASDSTSQESPVSGSDGTSNFNSDDSWSIAEQILLKCMGIHVS